MKFGFNFGFYQGEYKDLTEWVTVDGERVTVDGEYVWVAASPYLEMLDNLEMLDDLEML